MYSPWTALADTDLTVEFVELPTGYQGLYYERTIYLDHRLTQAERRCVLAHELIHYEAGHAGHQPRSVEAAVNALAAARLIAFSDLVSALRGSMGVWEVADALHVTESMLWHRLRTLSTDEADALGLAPGAVDAVNKQLFLTARDGD